MQRTPQYQCSALQSTSCTSGLFRDPWGKVFTSDLQVPPGTWVVPPTAGLVPTQPSAGFPGGSSEVKGRLLHPCAPRQAQQGGAWAGCQSAAGGSPTGCRMCPRTPPPPGLRSRLSQPPPEGNHPDLAGTCQPSSGPCAVASRSVPLGTGHGGLPAIRSVQRWARGAAANACRRALAAGGEVGGGDKTQRGRVMVAFRPLAANEEHRCCITGHRTARCSSSVPRRHSLPGARAGQLQHEGGGAGAVALVGQGGEVEHHEQLRPDDPVRRAALLWAEGPSGGAGAPNKPHGKNTKKARQKKAKKSPAHSMQNPQEK